MSADSSTPGFLAPTSPSPLDDDALDDFLQTIVVGITGLPGNLVRPRWQAEPPAMPDFGTTWAAVGVTHRIADAFAAELHDGAGEGTDTVIRHEQLDLVCSFYGPAGETNGARLRDGLGLAQNREALATQSMGLVSVSDLTKAPELIKNRWLGRTDLTVVIRREIRRTYPVLNLEQADVSIRSETITDAFTVSS